FLARIERLGGWLVAQDIHPGDVVSVLMKNSAAFLDIAFAVSHVGAVLLPVNYRLSAEEVSYIVRNAGARLLFVDEELLPQAGDDCRVVAVNASAQEDLRPLIGDAQPVRAVPRRT